MYNCRCTIAAKVLGFGKTYRGLSAGGFSSKPGTPEHIESVDFADEMQIFDVLEKAERETSNLPYEVNYTVTSDGKVWRVKGDKASVNPNNIPSSLKGSYSFHNHPPNETWYSFSAEDIGVFMEHKQKYSKASDDIYEYFMQRRIDTIDTDYDTAYNDFKHLHQNAVYQMAFYEGLDLDTDGFHKTKELLSKKYKIDYYRRKK